MAQSSFGRDGPRLPARNVQVCGVAGSGRQQQELATGLLVSELRDALLAYLASEGEKATCSEFENTCCQTQRCLSYWKENG